jgi:NADP-dependent 3-hydroxy acid dehydrogenase YdfG
VETELLGHNTDPNVVAAGERFVQQMGKQLESADIADAIVYALAQPPHVSINELLVRPTGQRN